MSSLTERTLTVPEGMLNPGPIGRTLRIMTGLAQAWFVISVAPHYDYFMSNAIPSDPMFWVAVLIAVWVLDPVITIGFDLEIKQRPRNIFFVLLAIAFGLNLWQFGSLWGSFSNGLIYIMSVYVHTHLGLAHILSGILGTPGCEMRSIPQIWAMLTRGNTHASTCPAFWAALDQWESNLGKKES